MARAKTTVRGRAPLARDSQQWMLDYLIQETGKVFHFQGEGRGRLPRGVRSHDMISKHLPRSTPQNRPKMDRPEPAKGVSAQGRMCCSAFLLGEQVVREAATGSRPRCGGIPR